MGNTIVNIVTVFIAFCLIVSTVEWTMDNPSQAIDIGGKIGSRAFTLGYRIVKGGVNFVSSMVQGVDKGMKEKNITTEKE
jgi:hypothetical protein